MYLFQKNVGNHDGDFVGRVSYENIAPANCPPETGGTRSVATEGVDNFHIVVVHLYAVIAHPYSVLC